MIYPKKEPEGFLRVGAVSLKLLKEGGLDVKPHLFSELHLFFPKEGIDNVPESALRTFQVHELRGGPITRIAARVYNKVKDRQGRDGRFNRRLDRLEKFVREKGTGEVYKKHKFTLNKKRIEVLLTSFARHSARIKKVIEDLGHDPKSVLR